MNESCMEYRERIETLLMDGAPPDDETRKHLGECQNCREYYEGLSSQDRLITEWIGSMEETVATGCARTVEAVRNARSRRFGGLAFFGTTALYRAAAAGLLILAGFFAGRLAGPPVDSQQLFAEWEAQYAPALKEDAALEAAERLQRDLAAGYDALSDQFRTEIQRCATETMAAGSLRTEHLLVELIEAIEQAQARDRQWVVSALGRMERNRLEDQAAMQNHLQTFAVITGDELARTRLQIEFLQTVHTETETQENY